MAKLSPGDPVGKPQPSTAADAAVDELMVMQPDITIRIGDQSVVVCEYSFWDAMGVVYSDGRQFLDDVVACLSTGTADTWEQVRGLVGRHRGYLLRAIAKAVDRDPDWVEGLAPRDADALFSTWWAVNGHFFLHEATVVIRGRVAAMEMESAGPKPSPSSPPPDSAAPTASGTDTPSGN